VRQQPVVGHTDAEIDRHDVKHDGVESGSESTSSAVRQRTWVRKRRKVPSEVLGFVIQLPERLSPKSVNSEIHITQIEPTASALLL
jgi:hypothetical protein